MATIGPTVSMSLAGGRNMTEKNKNKIRINLPVGTFEVMFERISTTRASTAMPLTSLMRAWGSIKFQKALGIPVWLKPSTVINIPQKNTRREKET